MNTIVHARREEALVVEKPERQRTKSKMERGCFSFIPWDAHTLTLEKHSTQTAPSPRDQPRQRTLSNDGVNNK